MRRQSGNFLIQALLAIALIVAFIPLFTEKLARREKDMMMGNAVAQIETAQTASRIYLRENLNSINYDTTIISGNAFGDTLEPYGLPLGFVPRTAFAQDMSLVINKTKDEVFAYIGLKSKNMSEFQRAELVRRLGFYASQKDGDIFMIVPLDENFSELVRKMDKNPDASGFLSDLDMGGFGIENIGASLARNGEFESMTAGTLSLSGIEDGRKIRNKIERLGTVKSVFQTGAGEAALSVTRGTLGVGTVSAKTISKFGAAGNLTAIDAGLFDFSMTAGRTSFTGPAKWEVKGNLITDNIAFSVDLLEISSFVNASRGQDVYVDAEALTYSTRSGIEVGTMRAANITLRDQTSSSLLTGGAGTALIDIRPAGTSLLPDAYLDGVDNDKFVIIADPSDVAGDTVDCKSIISALDGRYNAKSLSQNIICQYVFWQRLEKRIDIKQCLIDGRSDCENARSAQ